MSGPPADKRLIDVFDGGWSPSGRFCGGRCRAPEAGGGGDFSRGDVGQAGGVITPCFNGLSDFELSAAPSKPPDCSTGLCAESARWTAAAEGIVDRVPDKAVFLVGLNSALFLRDLDTVGMEEEDLEGRRGEVSLGFVWSIVELVISFVDPPLLATPSLDMIQPTMRV